MAGRRAYLDYNASAPLLPAARDGDACCARRRRQPVLGARRRPRGAPPDRGSARRSVAALVGAKARACRLHLWRDRSGFDAADARLADGARAAAHGPALCRRDADHPCLLSGGRFPGGSCRDLPVDGDGVLDLDALAAALAGHDRPEGLPLVAIHAANNETGVIQPVAEIAALVKAAGGILVVDAVQAAGRIPIDISDGLRRLPDSVVAQDRRPEGRRRHRRQRPT